MSKGKMYLIISAVLYGIIPFLTTVAYSGGANGITLTFLRSVISLPLLFAVILSDKRNLKITRNQFEKIVVLSVFGGVMPLVTLYLSYNYISTGLATTLHFIYPLIIILTMSAIYRHKPSKNILSSVIFVTVGIFMFADISSVSSKTGIILALLSGVFYSFYVIYMDKSGLDRMDFFVLTFYVSSIMSASLLVFSLLTDSLTLDISPISWSFSVLVSLAGTFGAMPLFQLGVRYEGAETAGILSTLEPITSIVLGALLLGEKVDTSQMFGAALIIFGVIIAQKKMHESASTA
jgi:drug/metabolite transporter (DMT)-like permease